MPRITGSMLYSMCRCPHRVHMDLFGDKALKDPESSFVQLLWERGIQHENMVVESLGADIQDLSPLSQEEREAATRAAMSERQRLIYSGRLAHGDLVGEPDLLRLTEAGYQAGDIKSGAGLETDGEEGKPKKHYAMQLALYTDILEQMGYSDGHRAGFIIDRHRQEVEYDLSEPRGTRNPQSFWDAYQELLLEARSIASRELGTLPALAAVCKECHWYSACVDDLSASGDLTLIPELGRSKRDAMVEHFPTVKALANANLEDFVRGSKSIIKGVGVESLVRFQTRSKLLTNPAFGAYLSESCVPEEAPTEVFFDIEDDPLIDYCYLHGFLIRRPSGKEEYFSFYADEITSTAERIAYAQAWDLVRGLPDHARIYYFSSHEWTWWRKLQTRHPGVASIEEVESMFRDRAIDLYTDIVRGHSEWPTNDHSIKTLAKYLGFRWRDDHPSGAASIEWYSRWCQTQEPNIKQRILQYNEDDCRATLVLLDGLRALPVRQSPVAFG